MEESSSNIVSRVANYEQQHAHFSIHSHTYTSIHSFMQAYTGSRAGIHRLTVPGGCTPYIQMVGMIIFLGAVQAKSFKEIKLVFVRV